MLRLVEAKGMAGGLVELTPNEHHCLWVMALNAHDTGTKDAPARTYFRGWEHLARVALRRSTYDAAAEQAVAVAVRGLMAKGYVKRAGRRHGQRHAPVLYELTL